MSNIIFLNGCGSSGKTSIARSLQHMSSDLWISFGIDTFIGMTPFPCGDHKEADYLNFLPGKNEQGPTMRVVTGPKGHHLFSAMPDFARLLADKGNNLIIDEVVLDDEVLRAYCTSLKSHTTYFVGVFCELSALQEREILRQDRAIGLSNDQIDRVHRGLRPYDLKVDTTHTSPFELARQILSYIKVTPHPDGFRMICQRP